MHQTKCHVSLQFEMQVGNFSMVFLVFGMVFKNYCGLIPSFESYESAIYLLCPNCILLSAEFRIKVNPSESNELQAIERLVSWPTMRELNHPSHVVIRVK